MQDRHRTCKLLLRHGIIWSGGTAWTNAHHQWLGKQHFDQLGLHGAYDSSLEAVLPAWSPTVTRPPCLRGVSTLTSFGLAVEIGGLAVVHRLHDRGVPWPGPDRVVQWRGSQPGVDHQNWEHARPPAAGRGDLPSPPTLWRAIEGDGDRWDQAPATAQARGHVSNQRLHDRWIGFVERRERPVIANVAVARALAGWCWSLAPLADTELTPN